MPKALGSMLEAARIQSEINRLFDNLLDLGGEASGSSAWIPNADILETRESLILKVDLPGVDESNLSISVHGGNVILSGEKKQVLTDERSEVHIAERHLDVLLENIRRFVSGDELLNQASKTEWF